MPRWLAPLALGLGVATAATLLGCGSHCDPPNCPTPVELHDLCGQPGACTLDGAPADPAEVLFPKRGQHFVVSLGAVNLDHRRALQVSYGNGGGSNGPNAVWPDARLAIVLLDGVPGRQRTVRGEYQSVDVFVWDPFPSAPATLDFSYEDGTEPVEVLLMFIDANCTADTEVCGE